MKSGRKQSKRGAEFEIWDLLKPRFAQPGMIKTAEAWEICKHKFGYSSVTNAFRHYMQLLIKTGQAKKVGYGKYEIFKRSRSNELGRKLFSIHTHAEIVYDHDPNQVVYREKDIIALLKEYGFPEPKF
jgi:hypothetical protein